MKLEFQKFIELSRTPTGRQAFVKYYLQPHIRTIVPTKQSKSEAERGYTNLHAAFDNWLKTNGKYEYGNLLTIWIKSTCLLYIPDKDKVPGVITVYSWYKADYSKDTTIHPQKSDYCNQCYDNHSKLVSVQQTKNLLEQVCIPFYYKIPDVKLIYKLTAKKSH